MQDAPSVEELKLKERLEFEERLRKAEENHAIEQSMRGEKPKEQEKGIWARLGLGRGPAGSVKASQVESKPAPTTLPPPIPPPIDHTQAASPASTAEFPSKSSWSWFGRGSSGSSGSDRK